MTRLAELYPSAGGSSRSYASVEKVLSVSGSAIAFDGSDGQGLTFGFADNPQSFTFACWLKTSDSSRLKVIFGKNSFYASTAQDFPYVVLMNTSGEVVIWLSKGDDFNQDLNYSVGTSLNDDTWHHLGIVVEPTRVRVWLDGTLEDDRSKDFDLSYNTREVTIAAPSVYYGGATAGSLNFIGSLKRPLFAPAIASSSLVLISYAENA